MAGTAPTDVHPTKTLNAGPVHCSVWLARSRAAAASTIKPEHDSGAAVAVMLVDELHSAEHEQEFRRQLRLIVPSVAERLIDFAQIKMARCVQVLSRDEPSRPSLLNLFALLLDKLLGVLRAAPL